MTCARVRSIVWKAQPIRKTQLGFINNRQNLGVLHLLVRLGIADPSNKLHPRVTDRVRCLISQCVRACAKAHADSSWGCL